MLITEQNKFGNGETKIALFAISSSDILVLYTLRETLDYNHRTNTVVFYTAIRLKMVNAGKSIARGGRGDNTKQHVRRTEN